jgi:hypothetical protein
LNIILGQKVAYDNIGVINTDKEKYYCTAGDLNNLSLTINNVIESLNSLNNVSGMLFKSTSNSLFIYTDDNQFAYRNYLSGFNISDLFSFNVDDNRQYLDLNIDNTTIIPTERFK